MAAGFLTPSLAPSLASTLAPFAAQPQAQTKAQAKAIPLHRWQGFALGAVVSLQLYHPDKNEAHRIMARAARILDDMENLFSLYRPTSVLCRLNRQGRIAHPPADFLDLLHRAQTISHLTAGAFDVTVQPLWDYYSTAAANHPIPDQIRRRVGYQHLHLSPDAVFFARPGMSLTLNGIAQGYATDRVADYLKSEGLTAVLIDIGEYRALGPQMDQTPWRIGLTDPTRPGALVDSMELATGAMATSAEVGAAAGADFNALFDPHSGQSATHHRSITVTAPDATTADGLSTGFFAMDEPAVLACLKKQPTVGLRLTRRDGAVILA